MITFNILVLNFNSHVIFILDILLFTTYPWGLVLIEIERVRK